VMKVLKLVSAGVSMKCISSFLISLYTGAH
jgi:hypothetical protein